MKPKYQELADDIRSKILSNEYPIGTSVPPELKLQESYQVSRHTVRQAFALLVNEGFLRKEKGSGTYVDSKFKDKNHDESKHKTIGVITTYLSDYIFPSIIRGIEEELQSNDFSLLLASTNNNLQQEQKCLENMLVQHVDGLIIEPTKSNMYNPNLSYYLALKEAGIPIVMINAYYEMIDLPFIGVDDTLAGFTATNYLIDQGHQKLAVIIKIDDLQGKLRMKGFVKACEERKIAFDANNIYTYDTENKAEVLAQAEKELLINQRGVTGVVCYNDEIANKLVQQLSAAGKRIPEDLSIIGQDDSYLSTAGEVQLTTLTHPKEQMGAAAAAFIIDAVNKNKIGENIVYTPTLVERLSVQNISPNKTK